MLVSTWQGGSVSAIRHATCAQQLVKSGITRHSRTPINKFLEYFILTNLTNQH